MDDPYWEIFLTKRHREIWWSDKPCLFSVHVWWLAFKGNRTLWVCRCQLYSMPLSMLSLV